MAKKDIETIEKEESEKKSTNEKDLKSYVFSFVAAACVYVILKIVDFIAHNDSDALDAMFFASVMGFAWYNWKTSVDKKERRLSLIVAVFGALTMLVNLLQYILAAFA